MLTAEQLQLRKQGIGGSDAGAVMGLNKYTSPLDVYNEKMGLVPPLDLSDNQAVHWGNVLEDVVAQEYARRTGKSVRRRNQMFVHKKHPFMLANIDRSIDGERRVLECKTAGAFFNRDEWGPSGTDQVPDSYLIQVAHYCAVMDYDGADLAVLMGGRDFRIYHIERDPELEKLVIAHEADFWNNHILKEVPPAPSRLSDIETLYSVDNGESIVAPGEVSADVIELSAIKSQIKQLDGRKKELETSIKAFMGENSVLVDVDGSSLATWKKAKDSTRFDAKALKSEAPDLYEQYCVAAPGSRRFLVK